MRFRRGVHKRPKRYCRKCGTELNSNQRTYCSHDCELRHKQFRRKHGAKLVSHCCEVPMAPSGRIDGKDTCPKCGRDCYIATLYRNKKPNS
jgi:hypothetical protein